MVGYDARLDYLIEEREFLCEAGLALLSKFLLLRAFATWSSLSVPGIEPGEDFHAFDNLAERRETRLVEPGVIRHIDEDSGGVRVRAAGCKADEAPCVGPGDGIVLKAGGGIPHFGNGRVGRDTALNHERG